MWTLTWNTSKFVWFQFNNQTNIKIGKVPKFLLHLRIFYAKPNVHNTSCGVIINYCVYHGLVKRIHTVRGLNEEQIFKRSKACIRLSNIRKLRNFAVNCSSQWKGRHGHPSQEWSCFWKCLFLFSYWLLKEFRIISIITWICQLKS